MQPRKELLVIVNPLENGVSFGLTLIHNEEKAQLGYRDCNYLSVIPRHGNLNLIP